MRADAVEVDVSRCLAARLSSLLGIPAEVVEVDPKSRKPAGAGVIVTGRIGGATRFAAFLEESLVRALTSALTGKPVEALADAVPALGPLTSEVAEAIGEGAGHAGAAAVEVEEARVVAAPPPAFARRAVFLVSAGGTAGLLSVDLESPSELAAEGRPPEVLMELELPFALTLGSLEMELAQIQQLDAGAVLPLGKSADGPVTLVVGGRVIARGELVVVDGCFGIKIDTVEPAERRLTTLARV
jgi:flagellar motor switch/type III secretory pathway protein FliN